MAVFPKGQPRFFAVLLAVAGLVATQASAAEDCGLCDNEIVTNSSLADCFLKQYGTLSTGTASAVVVDLSGCEQDRGVVEPLAAPSANVSEKEPMLRFMVSPTQLKCLKRKLEVPGVKLDPTATIELEGCE